MGLRATQLLIPLLAGCAHRGPAPPPPPTATPPALQAPAVGWYLRGELARAAGDLSGSARAFEEAALFDRQSPYPPLAAGRAREATGELERAREHYLEALRRSPGEPEAAAALSALPARPPGPTLPREP